uniref:F-box domain-containing protein n=1 Tax=Oryza meridionalis TaxID=40149 RepID=A0A0E0FBZ8_9ORYZ
MEEPPSSSSSPALPLDMVVEIAERSDPITLLRCAAACKHLRRVISGEGFRRDLRLRNADGFVPGLLHGFFFQPRWPSPHYHGYNYDPLRFVDAGCHDQLPAAAADIASGGDTCQIPSFLSDSDENNLRRRIEPVAARGGFVVLRTGEFSGKGYVRPIDMPRKTSKGSEGLSYLVLTADDGGDGVDVGVSSHSFRLLAVRLFARTRVEMQALTPDTGTWGPATTLAVVDANCLRPRPVLVRPPVVVAGVAYFLGEMSGRDDQTYQLILRMSPESFGRRQYQHSPPSYSYFILAVSVSVSVRRDGETGTTAAAATIMLLPTELRAPSYTGEATVTPTPGQLLLAPSARRQEVVVVGAARRPKHPGGDLDDEADPPRDGLAPNGVHQGRRLDGSTPESLLAAGVGGVGAGAPVVSPWCSGSGGRSVCWTGGGAPLWSARSARSSSSFALGVAICCCHDERRLRGEWEAAASPRRISSSADPPLRWDPLSRRCTAREPPTRRCAGKSPDLARSGSTGVTLTRRSGAAGGEGRGEATPVREGREEEAPVGEGRGGGAGGGGARRRRRWGRGMGRRRRRRRGWIAERSDPITLLRCAAACKHLRRVISGAGFSRNLRLRNADGFVPGLLRGFFLQPRRPSPNADYQPLRFVAAGHAIVGGGGGGGSGGTDQIQSFVSSSDRVYGSIRWRIEPVAARGGFVVLRTDDYEPTGKVCNPMTGYVRHIDMPTPWTSKSYLLLTGDDAGVTSELHPYRLLAVSLHRTGTRRERRRIHVEMEALSPDTGTCGPTTKIPVEIAGGGDYGSPRALLIRPPVVVDGVAYSLGGHPSLVFNPQDQRPLPYDYFILRVHVSFHRDGERDRECSFSGDDHALLSACTGEADVTPGQLQLVPSSCGGGDRKSLALLVGRRTQVEIWAMNFGGGGASTRSASRLLSVSCTKVVDLTTMGLHRSPCSPPLPVPESDVVFVWSGEASGAVVLRLGGTLCLLDRRTMVVRELGEDFREFRARPNGVFLPYEVEFTGFRGLVMEGGSPTVGSGLDKQRAGRGGWACRLRRRLSASWRGG